MKTKLIIAYIGNIIDVVATLILTQYYGFVEINPFMAWMLQWPFLAMSFKMMIMTGIVQYIYCAKKDKYTEMMANIVMIMYGGLGLYYITIFMMLIFI
jgi:hypothetical protein